jgi:serine/threonine protein phosphatase 1
MTRYAIGDIHGCLETFNRLLDIIGPTQADHLYLLGDYIHRGPDSVGVILRILELRKAGYQVHCLLGNHEDMILEDLNTAKEYADPYRLTLDPFVRSILVRFGKIDQNIYDFLTTLPTVFFLEDYILVHAGFDFKSPDPFTKSRAHCWIRDWHKDIDHGLMGNRIVLHGHTPIIKGRMDMQFSEMNQKRYLDLDGGCVFGIPELFVSEGYGYLCALDMDNQLLIRQGCCE